jgi:hypothetical protein
LIERALVACPRRRYVVGSWVVRMGGGCVSRQCPVVALDIIDVELSGAGTIAFVKFYVE